MVRIGDGVIKCLGKAAAAPSPAGIDDYGSIVRRIENGLSRLHDISESPRAQDSKRHDTGAPVHTCDTCVVVAQGGNGTRYMGTMTIVVGGVIVLAEKIPPIDIINIPIAVVIDARIAI